MVRIPGTRFKRMNEVKNHGSEISHVTKINITMPPARWSRILVQEGEKIHTNSSNPSSTNAETNRPCSEKAKTPNSHRFISDTKWKRMQPNWTPPVSTFIFQI
jgi:hypothetical protein